MLFLPHCVFLTLLSLCLLPLAWHLTQRHTYAASDSDSSHPSFPSNSGDGSTSLSSLSRCRSVAVVPPIPAHVQAWVSNLTVFFVHSCAHHQQGTCCTSHPWSDHVEWRPCSAPALVNPRDIQSRGQHPRCWPQEQTANGPHTNPALVPMPRANPHNMKAHCPQTWSIHDPKSRVSATLTKHDCLC